MSDSVITLSNISVCYGRKEILKDLNFTHKKGEIVSIVGPNGGGKTTLLKTIMGMLTPSSGTLSICGLTPKAARKKGIIGYLPQQSTYDATFPVTIFQVVAMARYARTHLFERLKPLDHELIEHALKAVNMYELKDQPFSTLSGGQKQRVLIARALALKPKILILDEPSTGLDSVAQDDFYQLLQKLRDQEQLSILMVSHDIGVVSTFVDQIACLKKKIHFHGNPRTDQVPQEMMQNLFGNNITILHHHPNCSSCHKNPNLKEGDLHE